MRTESQRGANKAFAGSCSAYFFWPGVLSALAGFAGLTGLAALADFFLTLALASDFTFDSDLALF